MKKIDRQKKLLEIVNVVDGIKRKVFKRMCNSKISPVKLHTLLIIKKQKNITQKKLANILDISAPAVTQIIDSLESEKLIERVTDKTDKRKTIVILSKHGKTYLNQHWKKFKTKMSQVTDIFTDEEIIFLEKIYKKIEQKFNEEGEE